MSTKIEVVKGPPPEVAANYFAIDRARKLFASARTAKAARDSLAVLLELVELAERDGRKAARRSPTKTARRRR